MYKVTVVYVYHDCFLIEYEDLSIVFDFPEEYFSPEPIFSIVKDKIEGKRVLFLASHYHWDHFSPKIYELAVYAKEAHIVLSHDIVEVHKIPRENTTVVHPGKVPHYEQGKSHRAEGKNLHLPGQHPIWYDVGF